MHAVICFYDTRGERVAFLRTALGTLGSLFSALAGHHDDEDVICLTRHAVNNPHLAMQLKYVGWCEKGAVAKNPSFNLYNSDGPLRKWSFLQYIFVRIFFGLITLLRTILGGSLRSPAAFLARA